MRRATGFTLLEMLIVLSIMGILMSIGFFQLRPPSARLFANSLQAQVQQGRFEAIKRNRPVAIVWNSQAQSFDTYIFSDIASINPPCSGTGLTTLTRTLTSEYRSVQVSGAFLERAGARGVVWYPNGYPRLCDGSPLPEVDTSTTISDGRRTLRLTVGTVGRVQIVN